MAIKIRKARIGERWEEHPCIHRQDGKVAEGGVGNLAR